MAHVNLVTRAQAQLNMLAVLFLLGMAVNLLGLPSETSCNTKAVTSILLALHGLIGIGLIVGAGLTVRKARKEQSRLVGLAKNGAAAVGITFIFGLLTMATENNWWSYAMAVGFLADFWLYGVLYGRAKAAAAK